MSKSIFMKKFRAKDMAGMFRDFLIFTWYLSSYTLSNALKGEKISFRKGLYVISASLLATLICTSSCKEEEKPEKPNVLFITIDDLRDTDYDSQIKTPNIDHLAEEGMSFERAYAQGTFSNPSRSSLLTGLYVSTTKVTNNSIPLQDRLPNIETLPGVFHEDGYHTFQIGKIFHGKDRHNDPQAWDKAVYPNGTSLGDKGEGRNLTDGKVKWCRWRMAEGTATDQADGQIARQAVQFLEKEHEKPFFLAVGFHKPHDPYVAPKKYFDMYPLEDIKLHKDPAEYSPTPPEHLPETHPWKEAFDKFDRTDKKEFLRAYYAGATFMDAQLGKVLQKLEETGLDDNTVIVLLSDHGYHLGEREWWNKTTLYEYSARAPLIVSTPEMEAKGRECSRIVEFTDIYPTLLDLCGLNDPSHQLAGRSFKPLLDDPEQSWKKGAYTEILHRDGRTGRAVRTENFRYIEWRSKSTDDIISQELFDHRQDAGEYHNLADDPKYKDVLDRMKDSMDTYISSVRERRKELHDD